jgi:hypothetical protein
MPTALKREHPAIQNMKFLNFFLLLWVIFALLDLDPDPATQINADPDTDLQVHLQAMFSETKSFLTRIRNRAFLLSPDMDSNPWVMKN